MTLAQWPDLAAPEETGTTFEENARAKALYYAAATGELTVAEDSGLSIDALDGAPGVESARFGGVDTAVPGEVRVDRRRPCGRRAIARARRDSSARSRWCAAGSVLFETRGTIEGRISPEPKGSGGFGYDPIFFYPPYGRTLAEAGEAKAAVSHRGQAFRALRAHLESHF